MSDKLHRGTIKDWKKDPCTTRGLGYVIVGTFVDHPDFSGERGGTSWVVAHDEATGEIETLNSRYTLIGASRA